MHTPSDQHAAMSYIIPDHLEHLRAGGKSETTIVSRREILTRLHRDLPHGILYAATEQIEGWLAHKGWSRWTRSTYANHIRGFYRWATVSGYLDGDPTVTMARPKAPKPVPRRVTEDELARALTCPEPMFTAVVLAAFAGLRVSEIARARREDITADTVYVPDGKGGQPGTVPTHPYLWDVISPRPAGLLVVDEAGREVGGHWLSDRARKTFNDMGMNEVRMHRFRHRFGTVIQETIGDLRVTQECLRHANISSTQGYTLVTGARRASAIEGLPVPGARAGL